MTLKSYKDLIVWQKAMQVALQVYKITATFPKNEIYVLTAQIRRSAVSIPSNIAEGRYTKTSKDFKRFLTHAYCSGAELETQLELAIQLKYLKQKEYNIISGLLTEVMKMLNVIINNSKNQ